MIQSTLLRRMILLLNFSSFVDPRYQNPFPYPSLPENSSTDNQLHGAYSGYAPSRERRNPASIRSVDAHPTENGLKQRSGY